MVKKFNQLFENNESEKLKLAFVKFYDDTDEFMIFINNNLIHALSVGEGVDEINENSNELTINFKDDPMYIIFDAWKWLDEKYNEIKKNCKYLYSYEIIASNLQLVLEFDDLVHKNNKEYSFGGFEFLDDFSTEYNEYLKQQSIKQFNI